MTIGLNPLLNIKYEPVLENLGDDYYDVVAAAEFPSHFLRFRNDRLLPLLDLEPDLVTDGDFLAAFGKFEGVRPFLALRYHGYQFGAYNPFLGDGRGFLYGQVRGVDDNLYDLGTKGSGRTPYSRTADGRLTLKGGVREVLAGEALHQLGVNTSRCLSLVETGESLWRGDEPSPTRSSVMVRLSKTHIRFGTLERLHYLERPDLIGKLVDSAIATYYPDILDDEDKYIQFYSQLVLRVAQLAAQWMAAGFCHGVLNTDNMSIAGESFDYGPYAFISTYNARFTAASFDYGGRYSYGNQPYICKFNLELLQKPLAMITEQSSLEVALTQFDDAYQQHYQQLMLQKLGLENAIASSETSDQQDNFIIANELLAQTISLLRDSEIGYHSFFAELAQEFSPQWREDSSLILSKATFAHQVTENWRNAYHKCLNLIPSTAIKEVGDCLKVHNPQTALLRPLIESVWQSISEDNDWQPFNNLVKKLQQ
ncbi:MAG: YdiU family protein [Cyanobacteria bacterium J06621_12]